MNKKGKKAVFTHIDTKICTYINLYGISITQRYRETAKNNKIYKQIL